jgi:ABC-type amino acid transport substrate-binding protein
MLNNFDSYIAAYTANLASLLVERAAKPWQLNTIEDAIDLNYRICIEANTGSEKHMKKKYPLSIPLLQRYESDEDMYDALNSKECDIMVGYSNLFELYELKQEYNPSCSFVREGQKVLELYQSFATKLDGCNKCSSLVKGT